MRKCQKWHLLALVGRLGSIRVNGEVRWFWGWGDLGHGLRTWLYPCLGIDPDTVNIKNAKAFQREVEREEKDYYSSESDFETGDSESEWTCLFWRITFPSLDSPLLNMSQCHLSELISVFQTKWFGKPGLLQKRQYSVSKLGEVTYYLM